MIIPLNIPNHRFNDDELVAFCAANPELRVERDEGGQLFINMTPTIALRSSNNSELITELGIWNRKYKAGKVLELSAGFFLDDSSVRAPDVAWIRIDRWNALSKEEKMTIPRIAPDFIVEIKSATESLVDLQIKMIKWVENGVRLAWLICPESQKTFIYQPGKPQLDADFEELLTGGDVLLHFTVRLSDILEY